MFGPNGILLSMANEDYPTKTFKTDHYTDTHFFNHDVKESSVDGTVKGYPEVLSQARVYVDSSGKTLKNNDPSRWVDIEDPTLRWTWMYSQQRPVLKYRKTHPNAKPPAYKRPGDAGMDLCALEDVYLSSSEMSLVNTGIEIEIQPGYEATIRPRSGLSALGYYVALGTIDCTYRGPLKVQMARLFAPASETARGTGHLPCFEAGDRIAQLVVSPVATVTLEEVQNLSETVRGSGNFGSSGVK